MFPFLPIKSCLSDLFVLKMLSEKDMYGYEIIKRFDTFENSFFYMDNQKIYEILHKFEVQNFITNYKVSAGERRIRTYYHLEPAGHQQLEILLEEYYLIFQKSDAFLKR